MNRVYESNGPDVKIRGTATHITEKYQVLARDAQVSGDRVIAENHLQHAEHYYRIVLSTQPPAPTRDNGQATNDAVAGQHDAETPPAAAEAENTMGSAEPAAARTAHQKHTKGNGDVHTQNPKSDNAGPGEPGESGGQPAAEPQTGEDNPAQKEQDGNQEAFV